MSSGDWASATEGSPSHTPQQSSSGCSVSRQTAPSIVVSPKITVNVPVEVRNEDHGAPSSSSGMSLSDIQFLSMDLVLFITGVAAIRYSMGSRSEEPTPQEVVENLDDEEQESWFQWAVSMGGLLDLGQHSLEILRALSAWMASAPAKSP